MRRCLVGALAAALLATAAPLPAQSPRDSVLAVLDEFFTALAKRDTVAMLGLQHDGAMMYAIWDGGDSVVTQHTASDANIRGLAAMPETMVERIWEPVVQIHGPLATVWAPYDFHIGGKFQHCGIDAATLVRTGAGWKIAVLAFTMEPTGCTPSPLGPPRESSG
jgi:hypothetical protein